MQSPDLEILLPTLKDIHLQAAVCMTVHKIIEIPFPRNIGKGIFFVHIFLQTYDLYKVEKK